MNSRRRFCPRPLEQGPQLVAAPYVSGGFSLSSAVSGTSPVPGTDRKHSQGVRATRTQPGNNNINEHRATRTQPGNNNINEHSATRTQPGIQ